MGDKEERIRHIFFLNFLMSEKILVLPTSLIESLSMFFFSSKLKFLSLRILKGISIFRINNFQNLDIILTPNSLCLVQFYSLWSYTFFSLSLDLWNFISICLVLYFFICSAGQVNLETHVLQFWEVFSYYYFDNFFSVFSFLNFH